VYGLRPPALDQLGLVRAIEEHAAALDAPPLRISVSADGPHRSLPAATEVAAYLIALEALTNVVHHAKATTCRIELLVTPNEIELKVVDNGQGIAEGVHQGVGLSSMRERAEELGGTVVVGPAAPGTRVEAHIPLGIR
jgi:signal transduction histidine kinase